MVYIYLYLTNNHETIVRLDLCPIYLHWHLESPLCPGRVASIRVDSGSNPPSVILIFTCDI